MFFFFYWFSLLQFNHYRSWKVLNFYFRRNSIVTGVNGVTRLLEKNDAACVLLEANLEPMLLVKHIVTMGELNNVSVILVPFLKSVTLETAGFASAAVALKVFGSGIV